MEENKNVEKENGVEKEKKTSKKIIIAACIVLIICFAASYLIDYLNEDSCVDEQTTCVDEQTTDSEHDYRDDAVLKPIIYLYPTAETELTVKLGNVENITCSYPTYQNSGWRVLAEPNGDLTDLDTGRYLYSLYYESENIVDFTVENEGFCVSKENITEFLEEKLAALGLTERESEEFIVYWLPKLQENEYNYIRFATVDEINENMPLEFSVEPDTLIRVLMVYEGLDEPISVEEQQLKTPERTGFVVVEWGGTKID